MEKYLFLERKERGNLEERGEKRIEGRKRQEKEEKGGTYKGSFVPCQKLIFVYVAERRGETKVFVASSVSSLHLHFGLFYPPLSCCAVHCGGVCLLRSLESDGDWRRREGQERRMRAC